VYRGVCCGVSRGDNTNPTCKRSRRDGPIDRAAANGGDGEVEAGTDTDLDIGPDTGSGTGPDTGPDTDPDTDTDPAVAPATNPGTDPATDPAAAAAAVDPAIDPDEAPEMDDKARKELSRTELGLRELSRTSTGVEGYNKEGAASMSDGGVTGSTSATFLCEFDGEL
jgi:hypothetical protein